MKWNSFMAVALLGTLAFAGTAAGQPKNTEFGAWGFDLSGMDPTAKPGDDFFDYANGAWDARTAIPADRSRFGKFDELRDMSEEQLRAIIEDAAKSAAPRRHRRGQDRRALRLLHGRGAASRQLDAKPIAADLGQDPRRQDQGRHRRPDGAVAQGGFGASSLRRWHRRRRTRTRPQYALRVPRRPRPARPRLLSAATPSRTKKAKYQAYVAQMLDMVGWADAGRATPRRSSPSRPRSPRPAGPGPSSRDRDKTYNPMTPAELDSLRAGLRLDDLARGRRARRGATASSCARTPPSRRSPKIFAETPLETLKAWQAFHVADQAAPYLSKRFVDASFEFRDKELAGQPEQRPRWKRGVRLRRRRDRRGASARSMSPRYFPPESKAKMDALVGDTASRAAGAASRSWTG